MQRKYFRNIVLNFKKWTRKSYAAFISIGRLVRIGNLSFDFHKDSFTIFYIDNKELFNLLSLELITTDYQIVENNNKVGEYRLNNNKIHH